MRQNGTKLLNVLEALYKQVAMESIDPFGLWHITGKITRIFYQINSYIFGACDIQNK